MRIVGAAAIYFALAFTAGFVLGTLRTLLLLPRTGAAIAVALELPIILIISWWASRYAAGRFAVAHRTMPRLAMGWLAFAMLMAAEAALGGMLRATGMVPPAPTCEASDLACRLAPWLSPATLLGLAGQLAFAMIPLVQSRNRVEHRATSTRGS